MILIAIIAVVLILGLVVVVVAMSKGKLPDGDSSATAPVLDGGASEKPDNSDDYERKQYIFTKSEFAFFKELARRLPSDVHVLVKMRMIDVIGVRDGLSASVRKSRENSIFKKHFDFVLCDRASMVPFAVVELDGASHKSGDKNDAFKDAVCAKVGLPLVRVQVQAAYTEQVFAALLAHRAA